MNIQKNKIKIQIIYIKKTVFVKIMKLLKLFEIIINYSKKA